jgi:uncharacterized protein involved in exopolysaccharide biosynthesis
MLDPANMKGRDYSEICRRHAKLIIAAGLLAAMLGCLLALALPNQYVSTALVLIEQQKIADNVVKPVVTEELSQRLATMQQQILSRTELRSLVQRFRIPDQSTEASSSPTMGRIRRFLFHRPQPSEDQLVDLLARQIIFTPVFPRGEGGVIPAFRISVTANRPLLAQQLCAEIGRMFTTQDLRVREEFAQDTTEFLKAQLETAKKNLEQQDARMAALKARYRGQLPGDEQMNMGLLGGRTVQLDAVIEELRRARQERATYAGQLARQLSAWQADRHGPNRTELSKRIAQLQTTLVALRASYTEDHPDVIKAKADLEELTKELDRAPDPPDPETTANRMEPDEAQQLRDQIAALDKLIGERSEQQQRLQNAVATYQARLQSSPAIEQEYKQASRDYETALSHYNDLSARYAESRIATSMESKRNGEQFRMVDAASLPGSSSFPKWYLFALGGFGSGLCLGFVAAFCLELRNRGLRTKEDVERYIHLPTLVLIPAFDAKSWDARPSRKNKE